MDTQRLLMALLVAAWISSASALSDGTSLLAIKRSWKLNASTWQGDNPCNGWEGVFCDTSNRVMSLDLHNKGILGPVPSEISNLDHLMHLNLSNTRNSEPPYNFISGDLSPIGPLTSLVSLDVGFNKIKLDTFPKAIFNLTNLVSLRVDNNLISGPIPKELSQLTKLQYLYIGNNTLSGQIPSELGYLASLQELSMWNNGLQSTIPPEFGNLRSLAYLNLHDCFLYGGLPKELGNLKNLINIYLYGNELTGTIPETWRNLTKVKRIYLYKNYLTKTIPAWLIDLPGVYNLSLDNNLFYGDISLGKSKIPYVSVTCNYLSGAAPTIPSGMSFNFSGNCIDDSDPNNKIKCYQMYYNCDIFLQNVPNGGCPNCPGNQVLSDPSSCVCTRNFSKGGSHKKAKLIGSITGVVVVILFVFLLAWRWMDKNKQSTTEYWDCPEGVQRYHYRDLARATNNFGSGHEIGIGGFGKVFVGVVDGKKVAIKRAHSSTIQSSSGFRNEVILLSRLHHRNLVHLLGFCEEDGVQILVYEYMTNGNLQTLLFKDSSGIKLDWLKRLDIALGVAQGLDYLHSFADPPVIHRDVKPSNVLLDDNWIAKLSDFGISRVAPEAQTEFSTRPAGTVGYIDPQYILREHLTTASDVYSFGMVLLELLSGQKSIDNTRQDDHNLVEWAKLKLNMEGLKVIIDPLLGDEYPENVYYDMVRLAIDCASFSSEDRPSMKVVVSILDACRWSVAPHLHQETSDVRDSFEADKVDSIFGVGNQNASSKLDEGDGGLNGAKVVDS